MKGARNEDFLVAVAIFDKSHIIIILTHVRCDFDLAENDDKKSALSVILVCKRSAIALKSSLNLVFFWEKLVYIHLSLP